MVKIGDKFILHSSNGLDYTIIINNINDCRPPEMIYGIDVYLKNKRCNNIDFCGENLLSKCEKVIENEL